MSSTSAQASTSGSSPTEANSLEKRLTDLKEIAEIRLSIGPLDPSSADLQETVYQRLYSFINLPQEPSASPFSPKQCLLIAEIRVMVKNIDMNIPMDYFPDLERLKKDMKRNWQYVDSKKDVLNRIKKLYKPDDSGQGFEHVRNAEKRFVELMKKALDKDS